MHDGYINIQRFVLLTWARNISPICLLPLRSNCLETVNARLHIFYLLADPSPAAHEQQSCSRRTLVTVIRVTVTRLLENIHYFFLNSPRLHASSWPSFWPLSDIGHHPGYHFGHNPSRGCDIC